MINTAFKMKKILAVTTSLSITTLVNAQGFAPFETKDTFEEMFRSVVILTAFWILAAFILSMIRMFLSHQLKRRMIDANSNEAMVKQLLPANSTEKRVALKWFLVPAAVGIGLLLISFFPPLGIHSIAIMLFCISGGYGAYYLSLPKSEK